MSAERGYVYAMSVLLGVGVVLAALVVCAMTVLVLVTEWQSLRTAFQRTPPERRRLALLAGAGTLVYIVVGAALVIASPWGQATWLVVMGASALVLLAVTVWSAVAGVRRRP